MWNGSGCKHACFMTPPPPPFMMEFQVGNEDNNTLIIWVYYGWHCLRNPILDINLTYLEKKKECQCIHIDMRCLFTTSYPYPRGCDRMLVCQSDLTDPSCFYNGFWSSMHSLSMSTKLWIFKFHYGWPTLLSFILYLASKMGLHYLTFMGINSKNKKKLTSVRIMTSDGLNSKNVVNNVNIFNDIHVINSIYME